jgi:hypothetical protein
MYILQGITQYTWHVRFSRQSMCATRTLSMGSPRTWQHFASHQQRWMNPTAPEKKGSWHNPQHSGWPIRRSATQFLSQDKHWSSNESQTYVDNKLYRFTRRITPACNRYIQYLLTGPTHRSLTNTGGGYNLGGASLPHHTTRPSQLTILRFPPKGPARSPD